MKNAIEELAAEIKKVRKEKGYSQLAFAKKHGIPQSRLSRIENGMTDLQASSLIELARLLDLELMLIPRQIAPIVRNLAGNISESETTVKATPLYSLKGTEDDEI